VLENVDTKVSIYEETVCVGKRCEGHGRQGRAEQNENLRRGTSGKRLCATVLRLQSGIYRKKGGKES